MKKILTTILFCVSTFSFAGKSQGSWGLYDYNQGEYQAVYNRAEIRSIASITKLFTANTILRSGLDLNQKVKVKGKSGGRFVRGAMVRRIDLMKAMLISSDNLAAESLANSYPGGFDQFITDTNLWIQGFGLTKTTIVDASGLLPGNQSNIDNLTYFLHKIKDNPVIRSIASEDKETVNIPGKRKEIKIVLNNTNPILLKYDNILISKTGTTNAAGKCVIMLVEQNKSLFAVVILGQPNGKTRNQIATTLLDSIIPFSRAEAKAEDSTIEFRLLYEHNTN